VEIEAGTPGVAVEAGTKLLIALRLDNNGKDEAREVTIHEARVPGATRELPASLPLLVGNLAADAPRWCNCVLTCRDWMPRTSTSWK
jgi:hypothetical protein